MIPSRGAGAPRPRRASSPDPAAAFRPACHAPAGPGNLGPHPPDPHPAGHTIGEDPTNVIEDDA